jgi:uncharacterized protein YndB with AHSA1/START domain
MSVTQCDSGEHFTASVSAFVPQTPERVWAELLHPGARWMLGANFETDFQPGSPVQFEGHFYGRSFSDHGKLVEIERPHLMHFTHYSPLSGLADAPENYHDIRVTLESVDHGTRIHVVQEDIADLAHANLVVDQWRTALASLRGAEVDPAE